MKDSTSVSIITIFCFYVIITLASCTSKDSAETSGSHKSLELNLYPLWIKTSDIASLSAVTPPAPNSTKKKKLFLHFVLLNDGSSSYLGLNGWLPNKPDSPGSAIEKFDINPDITLTKITSTSSSALALENETNLGNLFIDHDTFKNLIDKATKPNVLPYIVFFPELDPNALHHIRYIIGFSSNNNNPTKPTSTRDGIGAGANPTPPRQYEQD